MEGAILIKNQNLKIVISITSTSLEKLNETLLMQEFQFLLRLEMYVTVLFGVWFINVF
jgi:hypothetical protein